MSKSMTTPSRMLLFVPNLIGYSRVMLTTYSFMVAQSNPVRFLLAYAISQILDAFDGFAARHFDQCTRFGAVLDMLTDRMSTGVLFMVIASQHADRWGIYAGLLVLDLVSHWYQMYTKLATGKTTHKGSSNALLNFYYTFPYALLVHCIGNETYFVTLYLSWFSDEELLGLAPLVEMANSVALPICALKQVMNVVQLYDSCKELLRLDSYEYNSTHASVSDKPR